MNRLFFLRSGLFLSLFCMFLVSCNKETIEPPIQENISLSYSGSEKLKLKFASGISKLLTEQASARKLIKTEALKMFNNDYDVLYAFIKEEPIESGKTFRQTLLEYFENEQELIEIEQAFPLLTIFVPALPENSFSAEAWDIQAQIPSVAIRLHSTNHVPIIDTNGETYVLEAKYIPGFPVVVIKDNERVISSKNQGFNEVTSTRTLKDAQGIEYKFLDDVFDRHLATQKFSLAIINPDIKLRQAFDIYQNNDGWQRDYVYYDITPSNPNGPFSYDFEERIVGFRLQGSDVRTTFNEIADQTGDPADPLQLIQSPMTGWTDGSFDLRFNILVNGKNGIGTTIAKRHIAPPSDLFELQYRRVLNFPTFQVFVLEAMSFKNLFLDIPVFKWDLQQYAAAIRINVEEFDAVETMTKEQEVSVEFASNFGIEGVLKKIGLKFGASLQITGSQTNEYTISQIGDNLGDVIINFADKFFVEKSGTSVYRTNSTSSGTYSLSMIPKRAQ